MVSLVIIYNSLRQLLIKCLYKWCNHSGGLQPLQAGQSYTCQDQDGLGDYGKIHLCFGVYFFLTNILVFERCHVKVRQYIKDGHVNYNIIFRKKIKIKLQHQLFFLD